MKFGFRIPSIKKRLAAKTSLKRIARHSLGIKMPKGLSIISNPKKALYNTVYQKTSTDLIKRNSRHNPKAYKTTQVKDDVNRDSDAYGLANWWESSFSEDERKEIENTVQPTGGTILTQAQQNPVNYLTGLASYFNNPRQRDIANRIIEEAQELVLQSNCSILDKHFLYSAMIPIYYVQRAKEGMLVKAETACENQINLAPDAAREFKKRYPWQDLPSHAGYEQLAIIFDKQGKTREAIDLCQQAKQQGWVGKWDARIERYNRKLK
jgi:hypothetical protein